MKTIVFSNSGQGQISFRSGSHRNPDIVITKKFSPELDTSLDTEIPHSIWCVKMREKKIVLARSDGKLEVWSFSSGKISLVKCIVVADCGITHIVTVHDDIICVTVDNRVRKNYRFLQLFFQKILNIFYILPKVLKNLVHF